MRAFSCRGNEQGTGRPQTIDGQAIGSPVAVAGAHTCASRARVNGFRKDPVPLSRAGLAQFMAGLKTQERLPPS